MVLNQSSLLTQGLSGGVVRYGCGGVGWWESRIGGVVKVGVAGRVGCGVGSVGRQGTGAWVGGGEDIALALSLDCARRCLIPKTSGG